ncbi:MAG: 30S ribosomal protein S19 [Candidatus Parcubacteria bacterium]|nr:30S ribosomal protein S19 [Candidatus Parcubacteria bacterium]
MTRSIKKGPYINPKLLKKIGKIKSEDNIIIKTWSRDSQISPEMVGYTFGVHNGKDFIPVKVVEEMVGHRLGEFSLTRKFTKHGGKIQREIETKKKEAEATTNKAGK